jgi:hypothetical protein
LALDVPSVVVTDTSTWPAAPVGLLIVSKLLLSTSSVLIGAGLLRPKLTAFTMATPWAFVKPVPAIVTKVPPAVVPNLG